MRDHAADAKVFRAFSDEKRLQILCESGIVSSRKQGKWTYDSISEAGSEKAAELRNLLTSTYCRKN